MWSYTAAYFLRILARAALFHPVKYLANDEVEPCPAAYTAGRTTQARGGVPASVAENVGAIARTTKHVLHLAGPEQSRELG
jgi:hypothetical protein